MTNRQTPALSGVNLAQALLEELISTTEIDQMLSRVDKTELFFEFVLLLASKSALAVPTDVQQSIRELFKDRTFLPDLLDQDPDSDIDSLWCDLGVGD
jgi:hypothetical protein